MQPRLSPPEFAPALGCPGAPGLAAASHAPPSHRRTPAIPRSDRRRERPPWPPPSRPCRPSPAARLPAVDSRTPAGRRRRNGRVDSAANRLQPRSRSCRPDSEAAVALRLEILSPCQASWPRAVFTPAAAQARMRNRLGTTSTVRGKEPSASPSTSRRNRASAAGSSRRSSIRSQGKWCTVGTSRWRPA